MFNSKSWIIVFQLMIWVWFFFSTDLNIIIVTQIDAKHVNSRSKEGGSTDKHKHQKLQRSICHTGAQNFRQSLERLLTGGRYPAVHHSSWKLGNKCWDLKSNFSWCRRRFKPCWALLTQYHHAAQTAAEYCSRRIRMLRMQRFINSLQIGLKTLKFIPMSFSLPLCLFCHSSNQTRPPLETTTDKQSKRWNFKKALVLLLNALKQVMEFIKTRIKNVDELWRNSW